VISTYLLTISTTSCSGPNLRRQPEGHQPRAANYAQLRKCFALIARSMEVEDTSAVAISGSNHLRRPE